MDLSKLYPLPINYPAGQDIIIRFKQPYFAKYDEFTAVVIGHAKKINEEDWEVPIRIVSPITSRGMDGDDIVWEDKPYEIFSGDIISTYKNNILIKQIVNPKV